MVALSRELPSWRPSAAADALHVVVFLPDGADEAALIARAARIGVGIEGLSLHSYTGAEPPGLVLGCGSMVGEAIDRGVRLLADADRHRQAAPTD